MVEKESKKVIRTFSVASFLNDFGSDIIYPIWPLFVTSVLGANMAILGLIDGLGEAFVSISQAVSGYLADKYRRRKIFIWTGYLFGSLSRIGYALSATWHYVIPFRILDRMGKIRSAPRDAIVADISSNDNRGKNFGILRTMDNLGAVCGILFCIIFFNLGYKTLFLIAAIPSIVGAGLILFSIKEKRDSTIALFKGLSLHDLSRNFWIFLILSSIFSLGAFSYSFLLLYANAAGIKQSSIPVLYLVFTACAAAASYYFGKLSDRIGRKSVILISFILWIAVTGGFLFLHTFIGIVVIFILYGLHKAALEPVQKTFVAELAPTAYRSSSLGAFQMVIGICALPSSLLAGILWESVNKHAPLYLSIALTITSTVMLFFLSGKNKGNNNGK
jgi:MFS family permease